MGRSLFGALLASLIPSVAGAQTLTRTIAPNTYADLPAPTVIWTAIDDATSVVTTPFPIHYYGNTYTSVGVGSNGALIFPTGAIGLGNVAPGPAAPNNVLAPFWDDLQVFSANAGRVAHQTQGTAPNRTFTVEWMRISRFATAGTIFSMQVRFFEGLRRYEVDYGTMSGTATYSATSAMEDAAGAGVIFFAPSACTAACTQADFNTLAGNRVTVVGVEPDLTATFGNFPRGAFQGQQVTGDLILQNLGTDTATSVVSEIYLSLDATFGGGDFLVGTATAASAPNGNTTVPVMITVPGNAPDGDYYVFAAVDTTSRYTELSEVNNVVLGPRFATTYEIQPTAISLVGPGVNPGDTATFSVTITNNGVPLVGSLELEVYVSADQVFDVNDDLVTLDTATLTGSNQEMVQVSGPFPTLPPGSYYAIAFIDPSNLIAETNEMNNSVVSAMAFTSGPDFGVTTVAVPMAVAPGAAAPITTTLSSLSVAYSGQVSYRLWASEDQTVDAMDTVLGTFTVTFAGEASLPDARMVTFAASIPVSAYYVIARVDPLAAIAEVNENNNTAVSLTRIINGPDFAVTGPTISPATIQGGNTVMVTGTLRSDGLQFIGNLEYGVFVSPDATFDPGDTSIYSGSLAFGGQASLPVAASFPMPNVAPGGYTVFLVADPDNLEAEAVETNNAATAPGTFTVQGADLRVATLSGDPTAFIGRTYRVELTVENTGIADANSFQYAYFLSEDESIRIFDTEIFVSQTTTIASGGQMTFVDTVTIPTLTATASLWLGVIVDIYDRVPETNTPNNIARIPTALRIVFPVPDLECQIVETATAGAAGEQFAITRQILNTGVADAPMFEYRYYLSTNPIISTDDREVGSGTLGLGEGEDDYAIDVLLLPSDVPEGTYYVGLFVDPADLVEEVTNDNNATVGPQIPVFRAAIQFVTDRLPNATTGVEYEVGVYARGGPLAITWSVITGSLPMGLSLDATSGIISGEPTLEGLSEFVLRASSGTAYADKEYEIRVSAPTVELEIATPSLPTAIKGRPYEATLIAVGGDPPYVWEAISELPGLMLSADGDLTGIPTTPGNLPITVSVRDAVNNSDSKALVLSVINANQAVQITQVPLPKAIVGLPYCEPESITLEAQNGVPPYSWSLIGSAPVGMTFSMAGELCGVPEQAGSFPITVRAQDATGLFDTALFLLEISGGTELAISTFSLPDGQVNQPYTQTLTAVRGMEPYAWRLVEGAGDPPAGITIAENGVVSGTPSADGVFAFVVQVIDGQRRIDTQPLSIVVAPAPDTTPPDDGCGCSTTPYESASPLLVLFALGLLIFRRRDR